MEVASRRRRRGKGEFRAAIVGGRGGAVVERGKGKDVCGIIYW